MLTKLFDCQLHDGHPAVRIPVEIPESADEVLELLAPAHMQSLAEAVVTDDPAHNLALAHEELRVEVLGRLFDKEQAKWQREREHLASGGAALDGPATFEAAFPEIFERTKFSQHFTREDAKAEYFRLYSLLKSTAEFTAREVAADQPAPEAEHPNWTKIRKQKGLIGTERRPGGRQALLALRKQAAVDQAPKAAEAPADA